MVKSDVFCTYTHFSLDQAHFQGLRSARIVATVLVQFQEASAFQGSRQESGCSFPLPEFPKYIQRFNYISPHMF